MVNCGKRMVPIGATIPIGASWRNIVGDGLCCSGRSEAGYNGGKNDIYYQSQSFNSGKRSSHDTNPFCNRRVVLVEILSGGAGKNKGERGTNQKLDPMNGMESLGLFVEPWVVMRNRTAIFAVCWSELVEQRDMFKKNVPFSIDKTI